MTHKIQIIACVAFGFFAWNGIKAHVEEAKINTAASFASELTLKQLVNFRVENI